MINQIAGGKMASKELEEKRAYRLQLFLDAYGGKKRPDRVPHTSA